MIDDTKQGKPARRRLKQGLHVSILQRPACAPVCVPRTGRGRPNAYTLIISRDTVYPSEQEWETVLKHWPYHVEIIQPSKIVDSDRRMALNLSAPACVTADRCSQAEADIPTARTIQGQMF
jgi:hypothetical protein